MFIYENPLPSGMLRRNPRGKRGKPGTYKLRFAFRPTREHAAVPIEIGLHTRNINTAHARAVLILRAYSMSGLISGLYAAQLNLSLKRKISPSQKACQQKNNSLKQGMLSLD